MGRGGRNLGSPRDRSSPAAMGRVPQIHERKFSVRSSGLPVKSIVILDSGPLGLLMQRLRLPLADACRKWLADRARAGTRFIVPEIADYEVRRELVRLGNTTAVARLDKQGRTVGLSRCIHLLHLNLLISR